MNFRAQLNVGTDYQQIPFDKVKPLGWQEGRWYPVVDNVDGSYSVTLPEAPEPLVVMHYEVKVMQVKEGSKWVDCSF